MKQALVLLLALAGFALGLAAISTGSTLLVAATILAYLAAAIIGSSQP